MELRREILRYWRLVMEVDRTWILDFHHWTAVASIVGDVGTDMERHCCTWREWMQSGTSGYDDIRDGGLNVELREELRGEMVEVRQIALRRVELPAERFDVRDQTILHVLAELAHGGGDEDQKERC